MRNPDKGQLNSEDTFQWRCTVGERSRFVYSIEEEWEAMPGRWTLQLWHEGQMLAEEIFVLHRP